ncbi:hypothetical protein GCM10027294_10320 [Marinactinospora endophytica]
MNDLLDTLPVWAQAALLVGLMSAVLFLLQSSLYRGRGGERKKFANTSEVQARTRGEIERLREAAAELDGRLAAALGTGLPEQQHALLTRIREDTASALEEAEELWAALWSMEYEYRTATDLAFSLRVRILEHRDRITALRAEADPLLGAVDPLPCPAPAPAVQPEPVTASPSPPPGSSRTTTAPRYSRKEWNARIGLVLSGIAVCAMIVASQWVAYRWGDGSIGLYFLMLLPPLVLGGILYANCFVGITIEKGVLRLHGGINQEKKIPVATIRYVGRGHLNWTKATFGGWRVFAGATTGPALEIAAGLGSNLVVRTSHADELIAALIAAGMPPAAASAPRPLGFPKRIRLDPPRTDG